MGVYDNPVQDSTHNSSKTVGSGLFTRHMTSSRCRAHMRSAVTKSPCQMMKGIAGLWQAVPT